MQPAASRAEAPRAQKTREVAERKLAAAEEALARCGGLRRGRRQALRNEVALRQRRIERIDAELEAAADQHRGDQDDARRAGATPRAFASGATEGTRQIEVVRER